MPAADIKTAVEGKPVQFVIKTGNGKWKCQVHSDRAAYERSRSSSSVTPGISRSDSGLSSSSSSSSSGSSH